MEFKLGQNQIDFLIKYQYIKLNEWRLLTLPNTELIKEYENGKKIPFKKFQDLYLNNKKKTDWYYIGNMSKLAFKEQEKIYKNRLTNLKTDKDYYIKNPI